MSGLFQRPDPSCLPGLNLVGAIPLAMRQGFTSGKSCSALLRFCGAMMLAVLAVFAASPAWAQSVTYVNSDNGTISETATPCSNPLVRTYNVTEALPLLDVDIGLRGSHRDRSDVRVTLQHPDGTRVQLVDGDIAIFGNNFNFRLNDGGTQVVNTDGNGTNHLTGAVNGGFQHNFIPNSPLSAFNGKLANGTWRLEICDFIVGDSGTFLHSELYLTLSPIINDADLSLQFSVSNSSPSTGQQVTYETRVFNSSASSATANVTVSAPLPSGVTYVSDNRGTAYDPATGLWTVGNIAPGQTRTLSVVATVTAGPSATIVATSQVASSNRVDPDSTPGNNIPSEDDQASASLTVAGIRTAGIAPTLSCPNGSLPFAWSANDWSPGDTNRTINVANLGPVDWGLALPSGASWLSIAGFGGTHPRLTTGAQNTLALSVAVEFTNPTQISTITIDLREVVEGVQFTIFDVDFANNDFADLIRVTGQRDGVVSAIPVLTNGTANFVIGNQAFGDVTAGDNDSGGNVVVTFSDPLDTIVIEYGNHALAPADPDGQAIQIPGQFNICRPVADLLVTKSSTVVSDGLTSGGNDPFVIPGAVLRYCIQATNVGSATARDVVASDVLPASVVFNPGTLLSGASCSTAATSEDADAVDDDDTQGIGASFADGTIGMSVAELADGATAAVTFEVTVQ